MAYTVRQVAGLSGISIRTLHFYDEAGLLKPAYVSANGYRYYEEPQLLTLQQILFFRELGLELKEIKSILGRAEFEKATALESHRSELEKKLARTQTLIATIGKTIEHLRGTKEMSSEEMFAGFRVASGGARFDEAVKLGGQPIDCKVSGRDTGGAMCIFEFTGSNSGPRRQHSKPLDLRCGRRADVDCRRKVVPGRSRRERLLAPPDAVCVGIGERHTRQGTRRLPACGPNGGVF